MLEYRDQYSCLGCMPRRRMQLVYTALEIARCIMNAWPSSRVCLMKSAQAAAAAVVSCRSELDCASLCAFDVAPRGEMRVAGPVTSLAPRRRVARALLLLYFPSSLQRRGHEPRSLAPRCSRCTRARWAGKGVRTPDALDRCPIVLFVSNANSLTRDS